MSADPLERLLARLITGHREAPSAWLGAGDVFACATDHRLDRVLAHVLVNDDAIAPHLSRADLRRHLRDAVALEMARRAALLRLMPAFAGAGVHPILFKGDAIAHSLYPAAHLRPREDSDLLIHPKDRTRAEQVLAACGYLAEAESIGSLSSFQSHWRTAPAAAASHAVDLHWRLFNAEPFAGVLGVEEIDADATAVPLLESARMPSLEHQLIITAVHRVAHHYDTGHLLWLYDVHLLVGAAGAARVERTGDLARTRNVGAVLARGLRRAESAFGTTVAADVLRRLEAAETSPTIRVFLDGCPRQVDVLRANLTALNRWPSRVGLLRDHLFPSAAYMRTIYPRCPRALLGLAYLHRIVRGAPKWFQRPGL